MEPRTVQQRREELQILDVREHDEWAAGRIEGAHHIPLGQLVARASELDRERAVVTVCRSGQRASQATDLLTAAGWDAHTMDEGMTGWANAGLPMTTPNGKPGRVA